jgi:hypothetical protein
MAKILGTILVLVIAVLETSAAAAGFRSPESLVRNVYAYYGDRSSDLTNGLSIAILRKQFDKTYVAVAFDNNGRAVTLNFIVVNGPDGWVIADVESPHDSLRMFLGQHQN